MAKPLTTRMPDQRCPRCNCQLGAATNFDEQPRPPRGGDVTICIECGKILTFNPDLSLREPTNEEVAIVKADRAMWRLAMSRATRFN